MCPVYWSTFESEYRVCSSGACIRREIGTITGDIPWDSIDEGSSVGLSSHATNTLVKHLLQRLPVELLPQSRYLPCEFCKVIELDIG